MKLVQLNMERDMHLARVVPFLEKERPDLVCLQEVFEEDLARIAGHFSMHALFAPMNRTSRSGAAELCVQGVALLSREVWKSSDTYWYFKPSNTLPLADEADRRTSWQPLLLGGFDVGGVRYTVGTTHFMKSWRGDPDLFQRERMQILLPLLDMVRPDVLCGDFNIPRGTELYHRLAERFKDNVPLEYISSIDPVLHRVPGLSLMIDYVWTSARVYMSSVHMVDGVSDHCAIEGEVVFSV